MPASTESIQPVLEQKVAIEQQPTESNILLATPDYVVRLAISEAERLAIFRLRFLVFNLELNEGLESAYVHGYDVDRFDEICDHLVVECRATGALVGTYRLQPGDVAASHHGFYSGQQFDLTPFEPFQSQIVELGRACIHRDHRSSEVLHLLWRGIARYVIRKGGRYMMGCCSLSSLDESLGHATYKALGNYLVQPAMRTLPHAPFSLGPATTELEEVRPPKLLRAYLAIGAKICGEPAIDREFKTIDFLTILDLQTMHPRVVARFLGAS
jgi:putative hemolysin